MLVAAKPAQSVLDITGICVHANWISSTTPQWDNPNWQDKVLEIGAQHVRTAIGSSKAVLPNIQKLIDDKVTFCITVAGDDISPARYPKIEANIDFAADNLGPLLVGIESVNEYNHNHPTNWVEDMRRFQKWLYTTVRGNAKLAHVPVVAPSIWGRTTADYKALGDLRPNIDLNCAHVYPGGRRPTRAKPADGKEYSIDQCFKEAQILGPGLPLMLTEYGYEQGTPYSTHKLPPLLSAKYTIRGLLDYLERKIVQKVYIYALVDDVPAPNPDHLWGLYKTGYSAGKPVFTIREVGKAVSNLLKLFNIVGTVSGGRLDYTLSGITDKIRTQLFQRNDGKFILTMYQDVDIWNRTTKKEIINKAIPVKIVFANPPSKVEVYHPSIDSSVKQSASLLSQITVNVPDHIAAILITP